MSSKRSVLEMERKWLLTVIGRDVLCGCGEGPKWPILLNQEKTKGKKEPNYEVPNVENCIIVTMIGLLFLLY